MFKKFSDYMYSLLFTPLKKIRQAGNQFYLFFKVVGKLFDDTKADIFRVREESIVASASEVMLPEHGRDRDMTRLKGETVEGFRTRLSMKALIAQKAGTMDSLVLCIQSLELNGEVIPYYTIDSLRWAEFLIQIHYSLNSTTPFTIGPLKNEIRKVKPASSKDNYLLNLLSQDKLGIVYSNVLHIQMEFYPQFNLIQHHLEGAHFLEGQKPLNGFDTDQTIDLYPVKLTVRNEVQQQVKEKITVKAYVEEKSGTQTNNIVTCITKIKGQIAETPGISIKSDFKLTSQYTERVRVEDHLRYLDGNGLLDDTGFLNADIYYYDL